MNRLSLPKARKAPSAQRGAVLGPFEDARAATPELQYPGSWIVEWHFQQESATQHNIYQGTVTLEPL